MASQLSGIAIILFIAFGSVTFILLFIFAKRQITRFALKSRRGPHVSIGYGAPKSLCREIERRLDVIDHIKNEPWMLSSTNKHLFNDIDSVTHLSLPHLYRMKAIDDVKQLCNLIKAENVAKSRHIQEDILHYFVRLHRNNVFLNINIQVLYKFLTLYEQARYLDEVFTYEKYCQFSELLKELKKNFIHSNDSPEVPASPSKGTDTVVASEEEELIKTFSPSLESLKKPFTHETAV